MRWYRLGANTGITEPKKCTLFVDFSWRGFYHGYTILDFKVVSSPILVEIKGKSAKRLTVHRRTQALR